MRKTLFIAALMAFAPVLSANAMTIISPDGNFTLVASDPVAVGNGLSSVTLSYENSGSELISAFGGTIGANGNLHHEQFPGSAPFFTPVRTPDSVSAANSSFDSHFLNVGSVVISAPAESDVVTTPSGEAGEFGIDANLIGFGPALSGDFSLEPAGTSVDFAQIVAATGSIVDFTITFGTTTPGVQGGFDGSFAVGGSVMVDPMLAGDPADGETIDLTPEFKDFSNFKDNAIALSNTEGDFSELGAIGLVEGGANPELFVPVVDGENIDIGLDLSSLSLSQILPNTSFTSSLQVTSENGGDLSYTLSVTVPEPSTIGLLGLGVVGLVGMRRRS